MLLIASGFANICECFLPLTRWPEIIKSSQPSLSIALFFLAFDCIDQSNFDSNSSYLL